MAAARAGVACVLLPRRNAKDLPEVPSEVREKLDVVLVDTIEEVLARALEPAAERSASS
jgi:ATP-dependent Lon protease